MIEAAVVVIMSSYAPVENDQQALCQIIRIQ
ncbi:hypothetical protein T08_4395 [Trichinella sp. T8]|nr:hypothetical protein T08_4395 [Trichinella sp. T8]